MKRIRLLSGSTAIASLCGILVASSCKPRPAATGGSALRAEGGVSVSEGPDGFLNPEANRALWGTFCSASGPNITAIVNPNYSNQVVKDSFAVLTQVSAHSFKLYKDIMKMHQTPPPNGLGNDIAHLASVSAAEKKSRIEYAHNFLTYLCGEFRDRANMIEAKLRWVRSINYAQKAPASRPAFDPSQSPWAQMTTNDYDPFVQLSDSYFRAKARNGGTSVVHMQIGEEKVEEPVPGMTVCEVKFMFSEFVRKNVTWNSLGQGVAALQKFRDMYQAFVPKCSPGDEDFYYDFRGDSNFKPNSPEANGMIWFAQFMAKSCLDRGTAKPNRRVDSAGCRRYYENPFRSRWNAARAGLAAWLLRDQQMQYLDSPEEVMTILLHSAGEENYVFGDKGPWRFKADNDIPGGFLNNWQKSFGNSDFGIVDLITENGLEPAKHKEFIFSRISAAVDRHTNWYASAYDDLQGTKKNQAYSPFVASSYEISKSDGFTFPGATIPVENGNDCCKHWMFIFKIAKSNWYNPRRLLDEPTINLNFEKMWIDETSFGFDGLADEERAWDHLGSPSEDEHAEILYLHNMPP